MTTPNQNQNSNQNSNQNPNTQSSTQSNEWGDKPSDRRGQWHERARAPTFRREMTKAEVEFFRRTLVQAYNCQNTDIFTGYEAITNEADEDIKDYMILNYMMNCVWNSMPITRIIYSCKVKIPEYMKQQAAQFARAQGALTNG